MEKHSVSHKSTPDQPALFPIVSSAFSTPFQTYYPPVVCRHRRSKQQYHTMAIVSTALWLNPSILGLLNIRTTVLTIHYMPNCHEMLYFKEHYYFTCALAFIGATLLAMGSRLIQDAHALETHADLPRSLPLKWEIMMGIVISGKPSITHTEPAQKPNPVELFQAQNHKWVGHKQDTLCP